MSGRESGDPGSIPADSKFVSNFKWHKSGPCGVLSTPAMSTREVTPGKRPHGKHISSSLPISVYKADWHTQQWVIRRDDIFIYFLFFSDCQTLGETNITFK